MFKKDVATVPVDNNRKVREFLAIEEQIQSFKANHYEVFQEFAHLLQRRNDALEDAEKEVRASNINCGPFVSCGVQTRVDVDQLYEELGEEGFMEVGGTVETKRVLGLNREKFDALVANNKVPEEVVDLCCASTTKYRAPHKIEMP